MAGSAVATTRRSSVNANIASDVMPKVHHNRGSGFISQLRVARRHTAHATVGGRVHGIPCAMPHTAYGGAAHARGGAAHACGGAAHALWIGRGCGMDRQRAPMRRTGPRQHARLMKTSTPVALTATGTDTCSPDGCAQLCTEHGMAAANAAAYTRMLAPASPTIS